MTLHWIQMGDVSDGRRPFELVSDGRQPFELVSEGLPLVIWAQAQRSTLVSNGQHIFEFDVHLIFYNLMFDSQFQLQLQRSVNYCN